MAGTSKTDACSGGSRNSQQLQAAVDEIAGPYVLSPFCQLILTLIRKVQTDAGCGVAREIIVACFVHLSADKIDAGLSELQTSGYIYTTSDEDHFRAV